MNKKSYLLLIIFIFGITGLAFAGEKLNLAVLDMKQAINQSNEGKKLGKILEKSYKETSKYLSGKEQDLINKQNEFKNSMMLTEDARKNKEAELFQLMMDLKKEKQQAEQKLRNMEAEYTGKIFNEVKAIIAKISKKRKYDLVLESKMSQAVLLYSKFKTTDLTDEIIKEYNKSSSKK